MMNLIKTHKVYIGLALALAVIAGACWLTWTVTDSRWQSKYDQQTAKYDRASATAQAEARAKELQYDLDIARINAEAAERAKQADADAVAASASIDRLYQRINAILADASTEATGTRQQGRTANQALNLLADVLRKSTERNRQLAAFADKSWNASKQCFDSYNATR